MAASLYESVADLNLLLCYGARLMAMSNPAVVYLSLLFDVTDIEAVCVYVCEREGERERKREREDQNVQVISWDRLKWLVLLG